MPDPKKGYSEVCRGVSQSLQPTILKRFSQTFYNSAFVTHHTIGDLLVRFSESVLQQTGVAEFVSVRPPER